MDGFTPGCCCEMDSCACESCAMGGGGARDSCAAWREHYYWNHTSDDKKQFLVVASGDFRHSLRIRQEIGGHLRNMITESEPVKLEAPNGHVYPVEVRMEVGDVVLRSGWHKFVDAHQIEENFSILFMYRGDSTFKVQIFDSAGQERSLSCSQPPSGIFVAVPHRAPCDHHLLKEQVVPDPGHVQNSTDFVYTMLPGCPLTEAQDKKVLEIADTMKSEIPLHVAAMSKSNVSLKNCYVYIPLKLVDHFKEEIKLEAPDNNIYSVGASKHSDDLIAIESGWNDFVASLRIQKNDLLIFRSKGKNRLEVLILDPSGLEKTSPCSVTGNLSSSAQEMCDDSVQIVDPPPPQIIDLTSSEDDDIVREGTRESCKGQKCVASRCAKAQKMASTSSPCAKSGYGGRKPHDRASVKLGVGSEPPSNNLGGPSQRPYMLPKRETLPCQMLKKVQEKVEAIRSRDPIFVKVMTMVNVESTVKNPCVMPFCAEYASACLPDQKQALLLQMDGKKKMHDALLHTSGKVRRIHTGWKEFAGENALEVGDICLFQLTERNTVSLKMMVYLIRKSELLSV